ncbi:MAG: hypothetical protein ACLFVO_01520 [Chloroflexaceae bacterium]
MFDALLQQEVAIEADLLVLMTTLRGDVQTPALKPMLKIVANAEDFYTEAHARIRPLDVATNGLYLWGSAHYPRNLPDTITLP